MGPQGGKTQNAPNPAPILRTCTYLRWLDPYAVQAPERCSRHCRYGWSKIGTGVRKFRDIPSMLSLLKTVGQFHTGVRKHLTLYAAGRRCIRRVHGTVVFSKIYRNNEMSVT